ncbi:MAG: type IV toxin-antitoxin system AbiEi family antitoxin domain-containing protein [Coriobacteriia bacterium]|nr:type IV toxin-antitoxin system AbiEi family antitoxin domain-containing protein [Coriobacteriia bacterium]
MKTSSNISELQLLAASQWGLFSSAQAQNAGVGRTQLSRMVADGRAENLTSGIYRFTAGETASLADIKAAWMSIFPKETAFDRFKKETPDAIVAGRTAAYVQRIGDLYASPYTFIMQKRKQTTRNDIKYQQWEIDAQDIKIIEGLPVTTVERTIADLIRLKEDPSLVDDIVSDAVRRGVPIDAERLAELLAPLAARNGYPRHDGETFTRDLIERNADYSTVVAKALESVSALFATNEVLRKSIRKLSEIATSSVISDGRRISPDTRTSDFKRPCPDVFNCACTDNTQR